jgi:predicted NBD/HSP70 family sugar kinase
VDGSGETATTIEELARRIAGGGKQVAGATQAEVLWQIAQHAGVAARGDIAAGSGFSTATVSKAVALLIDEQLVDDGGQGRRRPGAPLQWTDRYAAVGVVIATSDCHPAEFIGTVTTLNGTPLPAFADKAKRMPISPAAQKESEPQSLVAELGEFIKALCKNAASTTPEARILGCGVSVGGHVDGDNGIVRKSFNTGWNDDFYLGRDLAEWLEHNGQPLDVAVENDVTSFALQKNLSSRPARSYVLVTIYRDGIGGGVVTRGRTRRGHNGLAGEIGHIYVGSRGGSDKSPLARGTEPVCRCGEVGCIEAWATPLAIFRRTDPERAAELAPGEQAFEDLFQELASRPQTDTEVTEIFKEAGTALGRGLAEVVLWLNPAKIFLYLPPALAADNKFLAGKSYLDAVHAELRDVFSVGDSTPVDLDPMTELELQELSAKAAASNVLRKLLNTLQKFKLI